MIALRSPEQLIQFPHPVRHSCRHRRRYPKAPVNPDEVIVSEMQGQRCLEIVQLLAEGVRQPRESPAGHPDREVLPLHVARRYEGRIRVAVNHGWDRLHDLRRGISGGANDCRLIAQNPRL